MSTTLTHLCQSGDDQAESQRDLWDCGLVAVAPAGGAGDTDGYQQQCPEEFSNQHSPDVPVIGDILDTHNFLHSWKKMRELVNGIDRGSDSTRYQLSRHEK